MTPEEAIELLRSMQNPKQDYANLVCAPAFCTGYRYVYPEPEDYAIEEAIKALKEIQQYREIGTVEECREAVEKQKAKKIVYESESVFSNGFSHYRMGKCPMCDRYYNSSDEVNYCSKCGQALMNENLEGMEGGTGQV